MAITEAGAAQEDKFGDVHLSAQGKTHSEQNVNVENEELGVKSQFETDPFELKVSDLNSLIPIWEKDAEEAGNKKLTSEFGHLKSICSALFYQLNQVSEDAKQFINRDK